MPKCRCYMLLIALLLSVVTGCNDKGTNDDKPILVDWLDLPSCSWSDDFMYFVYIGDSIHPLGIYRASMTGDPSPELVVRSSSIGAISPCGTRLAYNLYGDLWVEDISGVEIGNATPVLVIPIDSSGGAYSIGWRGCDTILYNGIWLNGIYQLDLTNKTVSQLLPWGRDPTASRTGEVISFKWGTSIFQLKESDVDTIISFNPHDYLRRPVLSPNGQNVVYAREWSDENLGSSTSGSTVETINVGTGLISKIADIASMPTWTSDGRIVYVNYELDHFCEIWITDSLGGEPQVLLTHDDL